MRQSCRIPGHVLAHLPDSQILSFVFHRHLRMAQNHVLQLLHGWGRKKFPRLQVMERSREDPRVALCPSRNHNSIAARLVQQRLRILGGKDVSISNDRYLHGFFYPANNIPVCGPGIILFPRPAVHSHCSAPGVLDDLRDLHRIDIAVRKTLAELHCHRLFYSLHHGAKNRLRQLGILHHR